MHDPGVVFGPFAAYVLFHMVLQLGGDLAAHEHHVAPCCYVLVCWFCLVPPGFFDQPYVAVRIDDEVVYLEPELEW